MHVFIYFASIEGEFPYHPEPWEQGASPRPHLVIDCPRIKSVEGIIEAVNAHVEEKRPPHERPRLRDTQRRGTPPAIRTLLARQGKIL